MWRQDGLRRSICLIVVFYSKLHYETFHPFPVLALSITSSECTVSAEQLGETEKMAQEAGINLDGEGELRGWVGGTLVLVPTYKEIEEWSPIAQREL
jgi:hypothetical protein